MSVERPLAPSTLSRASTTVCESIEEGQPATGAPASVVQGTYATPPRTTPIRPDDGRQVAAFQNSMQHVIVIEHGDDCRSKCTIHERVLCKHSEKMRGISTRAEPLREAHAKCDDYLERIESVTIVNLSPEQFMAEKLEAKLLRVITNVYKNCPLEEYEPALKNAIKNVLNTQFSNKNFKPSVEKPKNLKAFQDLNLNQRLHLLNSEGLLEVAQEMGIQLARFKATERQKAKVNVNRAWAQGRLILRDATRKSVLSLVEWAYNEVLHYEDTEHLYDLWALATRLQFDVLAEECMNRLYNSASASLCNAFSDGVPLRSLLGLPDVRNVSDAIAQSDDVVATVFHHVLKDVKPPEKLSELIIDALARGMDSELWVQVQFMVNPDTARKLIDFMIAYRDVKAEGSLHDASLIKHEGPQEGHHAQPESNEAQQQPAFTG